MEYSLPQPDRRQLTIPLKVLAVSELLVGVCLLVWVAFQIYLNGWPSQIKPSFGSEVHLIYIGTIYLAAAFGGCLIVGAAGIAWIRRWQLVLHVPLLVLVLLFLWIAAPTLL